MFSNDLHTITWTLNTEIFKISREWKCKIFTPETLPSFQDFFTSNNIENKIATVPPTLCVPEEMFVYEFDLPVDLCKYLIGRNRSRLREISEKAGFKDQIDAALRFIRVRFPLARHPELTLAQTNNIQTQLELLFGEVSDVVISSVVEPNRIFMQQINNPFYPYFAELNDCMDLCYNTSVSLSLPKPIQPETTCVAPYNNSWFRAVVVKIIPPSPEQNQSKEQVVIRFADYGSYGQSVKIF